MTKRMQRQRVVTLVTAGLFFGVLIGTIASALTASYLYDQGHQNTGMVALIAAICFGVLAVAAAWTLFYRLGGLLAERRRSKVK